MRLLVSTREVAEFLKKADAQTFEPHILQAQRQITSFIRSKAIDEVRTVTNTFTVDEWTSVVQLRDGPLSSLTSFTLDGVAIAEDDLTINPWSILFPGTGTTVVVTYQAGYTPYTIPYDLKGVLIALAGAVNAQPNVDIVYEKIGDYTYQRQTGVPGSQSNQLPLPAGQLDTLKRYSRPSKQMA